MQKANNFIMRAALKARRDGLGAMVTVELEHLDLLSELPTQAGAVINSVNNAARMSMPMGEVSYREAIDGFSKNLIQRVLVETQGNRAAAARQLGLDSGNFHRMLKRLELL